MSTIPNNPESEGIPDTADDTSTAYDEHDRPRFEDSPVALPADEAVGVDDYGVTADESGRDEPLKARLVRERHDVSPDDPETAADGGIAYEAMSDEAIAQAARDADTMEDERLDTPPSDEVGRLVAPDEGGLTDEEAQSLAYDAGEIQGRTSEETAMHQVPADEEGPVD